MRFCFFRSRLFRSGKGGRRFCPRRKSLERKKQNRIRDSDPDLSQPAYAPPQVQAPQGASALLRNKSFRKNAPRLPPRSVQTMDDPQGALPGAGQPFPSRPKLRRATSCHPGGGSQRTSSMRGFTIFVHDVFLQFRTHLRGSSSDCSAAVIREGGTRKKPTPASLRRWVRNFFSLASCFSFRPKRS